MKELWHRLAAQPLLLLELGIASLLVNLLALASPLYVTQVLNRYVVSGVDATLITMTVGVILAILLEWGFRHARLRLAMGVGMQRDRELTHGTLGLLTTAKADPLLAMPSAQRREIPRHLHTIRAAYSAPNLAAMLDAPFSVVTLAVLMALHPVLGLIGCGCLLLLVVHTLISQRITRRTLQKIQDQALRKEAVAHAITERIDTVRAFGGAEWMRHRWLERHHSHDTLQRDLETHQGISQGVQGVVQALLSVMIIAFGARLVLAGELQVGTLIGANILAGRAMAPLLRLMALNEGLVKAGQALTRLEQLAGMPVERSGGATLKAYQGGLELRDLAKRPPHSPMPLFESVTLTLPPGGVLGVSGDDGMAKSMLARLLIGVAEPDRGQILADGVDIAQLDPGWWRSQLIYLPREPEFLEGTIRENLTRLDPEIPVATLSRAIADAGLAPWLDGSPQGLESGLTDGGAALSPDLRKRLALARALLHRGRLAILDEPTENLDPKGLATLYGLLRQLSLDGTTLVIFTHDPHILRAASLVLDLNHKPKPLLINRIPA
ncbi:MAG: ATP-binding cassette domain-containing protein [Magnetococcales bacterium]|nr:ATP-binding cassette domain-containing protein [Magnetococcales bacterium]